MVGAGVGDEPVGRREVEDAALGLDAPPLHRVLGRDAVELAVEDGGVGRIGVQQVGVDRGADQRALGEVTQPARRMRLRGTRRERHEDEGEGAPTRPCSSEKLDRDMRSPFVVWWSGLPGRRAGARGQEVAQASALHAAREREGVRERVQRGIVEPAEVLRVLRQHRLREQDVADEVVGRRARAPGVRTPVRELGRDQLVQRLETSGTSASVDPQESIPSRAFLAIRSPKRAMYALSGAACTSPCRPTSL